MIMKLLEVRTFILKIYQKTRFIINPIIKFILSMITFNWINAEIGYDPRFTGTKIVLLLSVICAVTPGGVLVFFAMVLTLLHVYRASIFMAILLLLLFIVLYGMLMRFAPRQALAAVAIPVLSKYGLQYCVPLYLGCTANPLSILPVACGVIIQHTLEIVKAGASREVSLKDLDGILNLYRDVADAFIADKQMIITIAVFALVIIAVYLIRKCSFDYAFQISIGAGIVVNIIGFLVGDLRFDVMVSVGSLIWNSLVAGVITLILELFKRILDYSAIEKVQFEDEDYYYYVKAVPKVNVSIPRHNVKHMSDYDDTPEDDSSYEYDYDSYPENDSADDGEVRYEEFGESDFAETEENFEDRRFRYDRDEDMLSYGMQKIGPADDDEDSSNELADDGYEVEMTLDDDSTDN